MPIFTHEIKSGLRRGVTALPLFGSAATNTLVLGVLIVLVIVAICVLFAKMPPGMGAGKAGTARYIARCAIYATPVVLLLLYVYSGAIAATVEGAGAADVADFVGASPRMRQDGGNLPSGTPGKFSGGSGELPRMEVSSDAQSQRDCRGGSTHRAPALTSISAQLAAIERNLPVAGI